MKLCINSEYAPEYLKEAAEQYAEIWQINEAMFVHGRGHRKTTRQRHYEKLKEYAAKLEEYVEKIKICGEDRNSYSKTCLLYTSDALQVLQKNGVFQDIVQLIEVLFLTRALPCSLPSYFAKFLMKRPARSLAFSSH